MRQPAVGALLAALNSLPRTPAISAWAVSSGTAHAVAALAQNSHFEAARVLQVSVQSPSELLATYGAALLDCALKCLQVSTGAPVLRLNYHPVCCLCLRPTYMRACQLCAYLVSTILLGLH